MFKVLSNSSQIREFMTTDNCNRLAETADDFSILRIMRNLFEDLDDTVDTYAVIDSYVQEMKVRFCCFLFLLNLMNKGSLFF